MAQLDFGDGDFFLIDDVKVSPTTHVTYRWRFLGTSEPDVITWRLEPAGSDTIVAVSDWHSDRDPESNQELEEGWRDFTNRLVRFLATGSNTRYDWRRTLDAAIELPIPIDAARRLLSVDASRWLPLSAGGLRPGGTVILKDAAGCDSYTLDAVSIADAPP